MAVTITKDLREIRLENFGIFDGLFGGFWGIIAGPTGICLSRLNNLSHTQCLWKVYITFIVFTMMGSIFGFVLNIMIIINHGHYKSDSFTVLSSVQLILYIGKDSYLNLLIKRNLSSFYRFVLGFLELRLFKMPISLPKSIIRANTSRKCFRCSKQQWPFYRRQCKQ